MPPGQVAFLQPLKINRKYYLRILGACRMIYIHSSSSQYLYGVNWFSPGHNIFEEHMIEARYIIDKLIDGLARRHVFTVLKQDRRNYVSDCGRFLTSWSRARRFIRAEMSSVVTICPVHDILSGEKRIHLCPGCYASQLHQYQQSALPIQSVAQCFSSEQAL